LSHNKIINYASFTQRRKRYYVPCPILVNSIFACYFRIDYHLYLVKVLTKKYKGDDNEDMFDEFTDENDE
jgi:hypothetical protein